MGRLCDFASSVFTHFDDKWWLEFHSSFVDHGCVLLLLKYGEVIVAVHDGDFKRHGSVVTVSFVICCLKTKGIQKFHFTKLQRMLQ